MTKWEKLADLLGISEEDRESLFNDIVTNEVILEVYCYEDGSIDWRTHLTFDYF